MTKLEICAIEDANPGLVYLYPEGAFYKAYQKSAWILCTKVHPFKVSSRPLKGLDGPLLSVGFSQSSLDKFSAGLAVEATEMASRIERNFRYSLGEDIRKGAKSAVLSITLAD